MQFDAVIALGNPSSQEKKRKSDPPKGRPHLFISMLPKDRSETVSLGRYPRNVLS